VSGEPSATHLRSRCSVAFTVIPPMPRALPRPGAYTGVIAMCRLQNVEAGHAELLAFYENISKHRALILKLFAVLALLILVVAVVRR
jgi:hypothetical protein